LTNRCVLDSVLWFHLECPKAVAKFDDPIEFKRKFRDFLAEQRQAKKVFGNVSEEEKKVEDEYYHVRYPEDIKEHTEFRQFQDVFKQYSPVRRPDPEDTFEDEDDIPEPYPEPDKKAS
jgi:hypothetical protein